MTETVYFVGDTPESDMRGTNEYNESLSSEKTWYSILVHTGVFEKGTKPSFQAQASVDTVLDAVKHGMKREFTRALNAKLVDGGGVLNMPGNRGVMLLF